jgi:general secretion pathway protein H
VVCALAIFAIVAAIMVPALPHGTSRARLQSFALATAALLKADRDAAIRQGNPVATRVDAPSRLISSGASDRTVQIPNDVAVDALLAAQCSHQSAHSTIRFFASGMSCGGAIALTRSGFGYEVRVNWLTGRVDIVAINPA